MEILTFNKKTRREQKNSDKHALQHERSYFDFVASGQSLKTKLHADEMDLISPLGWGDEKYERELIKEFTGEKKSEIPGGRVMIYVCPECGGIACGGISAGIEITKDKVTWKNFGYQSNNRDIDLEPYRNIPPIEFDKTEYLEKFETIKR